jgi:hypothetical protein
MKPVIIGLGLALALAQAPFVNAQNLEALEDSRSTLQQWVEVRNTISEERSEWQEEKEILEDMIATLENEIASLKEEIETAEKAVAETEDERTKLQSEASELREMQDFLYGKFVDFRPTVLSLADFMPEPLSGKNSFGRLRDTLSRKPPESSQALNDIALPLVGLVQEMDNFNHGVSIHSQLLNLDGNGNQRQFSILYIGLSNAFYVDDAQENAGIGVPSAGGWEWKPMNQLASEIGTAVAIREKQEQARFTMLPVEITDISLDAADVPEE